MSPPDFAMRGSLDTRLLSSSINQSYISCVHACAARDRVIVLQSVNQSVCQSVSQSVGTKMSICKQIGNASGFLLQQMSSKLKSNNLHTLHKQKLYEGL